MFYFRTENKSNSAKVESDDESKESTDKAGVTKKSRSSVSPSNESKSGKSTECLAARRKRPPMVADDDLLPAENTIRVTHIKEKSVPECSKRNITSPLSVEVCIQYSFITRNSGQHFLILNHGLQLRYSTTDFNHDTEYRG